MKSLLSELSSGVDGFGRFVLFFSGMISSSSLYSSLILTTGSFLDFYGEMASGAKVFVFFFLVCQSSEASTKTIFFLVSLKSEGATLLGKLL